MNKVQRISYGTIYFPLSILILCVFFWDKPISFFLSVCVLTFADPIASIIGSKSTNHFYPYKDKKSVEGSLAMFSTSFIIIFLGTDMMAQIFGANFFLPIHILIGLALFTSLCSTLSEMVSYKGSDNLSIPIITFFSYEIFLINYTHGNLYHLIVWSTLSIAIFSGAYKYQSLSLSGAVGGFLVGILIFGSGGWNFIFPLIFFFISSSLLSILKKKTRPHRDIVQILANGGVPTFFALSYFFFPSQSLILGFIGSLSAATADTWATEIGFLSKKNPYLLFSNTSVNKGTSGSISLLGTFGSIVGAFFVAIISAYLFELYHLILIITISGAAGSFIDSFAGRYFQGKFQCNNCKDFTEDKYHCNAPTLLISGVSWVDNNFVNFINTLTGASIMLLINSLYG